LHWASEELTTTQHRCFPRTHSRSTVIVYLTVAIDVAPRFVRRMSMIATSVGWIGVGESCARSRRLVGRNLGFRCVLAGGSFLLHPRLTDGVALRLGGARWVSTLMDPTLSVHPPTEIMPCWTSNDNCRVAGMDAIGFAEAEWSASRRSYGWFRGFCVGDRNRNAKCDQRPDRWCTTQMYRDCDGIR